jgi:hypothetical protein
MFSAITFMAMSLGAPPDADVQKRAEDLVARLGSPSYRDRETASRKLIEIGFAAKDAVLAGQKSADTEISERCTQLYPVIWQADLERRIKRFLDAADGSIPDDLPGAAKWVQIAGDGKTSRDLYAAMVRVHHEPLSQVELHPERLRDVYLEFIRGIHAHGFSAGPAGRVGLAEPDVLLFLFLGAAGDVRPVRQPGISSSYYSQFLSASYLTGELAADPPNTPFRKLYAGWLAKERYSIAVRRGIDVAAQHKVHECAPAILKIVSDRDTLGSVRATALLGFAKLGTKDDIPALAPLLKDELQIASTSVNGERGTVQMRDVALAAAIHLTGQNPLDFGFQRRPPANISTVSYIYYAFTSDEKRAAAHAKWKEWATHNLKK